MAFKYRWADGNDHDQPPEYNVIEYCDNCGREVDGYRDRAAVDPRAGVVQPPLICHDCLPPKVRDLLRQRLTEQGWRLE